MSPALRRARLHRYPLVTCVRGGKTRGQGHLPQADTEDRLKRPHHRAPPFAAEQLRILREFATPNAFDAVFATRNGTWHQVVNMERRWRQIRKDTGLEWVTPHTFRKTVATLVSERATSELAARRLGHSSSQITRDFHIAKPPIAADLSELLEVLGNRAPADDAPEAGT